jgi:hypothetical protein
MGYDHGLGLGVNQQGSTNIIEESTQKGRRGLGFTFEQFDNQTDDWDFNNDPVDERTCLFAFDSYARSTVYV